MKTKKVNILELKEIVLKMIKEEIEFSVQDRRTINDLKKMGYNQKNAEKLVKKYTGKKAGYINSIEKKKKLEEEINQILNKNL